MRYVFLFASLYLLPIAFLDFFHFNLLLKAVKHAQYIENNYFDGKLQITTKLTSPILTILHTVFVILVYVIVIIAGIASFMIKT